MSNIVAIIAPTKKAAKHYASRVGWFPNEWFAVTRMEDVIGIRPVGSVSLPTSVAIPDYEKIVEYLKIRNIAVKAIIM